MNKIKTGFAILSFMLASQAIHAQGLGGLINQAEGFMKNKEGNTSNNNATNNNTAPAQGGSGASGGGKTNFSGLSQGDMTDGLRQALTVGVNNAATRLSAPNGFFGNAVIKILMPPEAAKVESTLREVGMGSQVDKAILAMNRAAEDASSKAAPIFVDAITHMSIQDALSILQGGNNAATQYLKVKTSDALTIAFKPVIQASLSKVNATKYWNQVFSNYNKLPMVEKVNPDLASYVTGRALNGLFIALADEEAKIRLNPAAQVTDLLKKVFGSH